MASCDREAQSKTWSPVGLSYDHEFARILRDVFAEWFDTNLDDLTCRNLDLRERGEIIADHEAAVWVNLQVSNEQVIHVLVTFGGFSIEGMAEFDVPPGDWVECRYLRASGIIEEEFTGTDEVADVSIRIERKDSYDLGHYVDLNWHSKRLAKEAARPERATIGRGAVYSESPVPDPETAAPFNQGDGRFKRSLAEVAMVLGGLSLGARIRTFRRLVVEKEITRSEAAYLIDSTVSDWVEFYGWHTPELVAVRKAYDAAATAWGFAELYQLEAAFHSQIPGMPVLPHTPEVKALESEVVDVLRHARLRLKVRLLEECGEIELARLVSEMPEIAHDLWHAGYESLRGDPSVLKLDIREERIR